MRHSVLLISTDPAHNLSDTFDQKISKFPTQIRGFQNLFAMVGNKRSVFSLHHHFLYFQEIDPEVFDENEIESDLPGSEGGIQGLAKELLQDVASSLPGIDEAKSFIQVMGYVHMLPTQ